MTVEKVLAIVMNCGWEDVEMFEDIDDKILYQVLDDADTRDDLNFENILTQCFEIARDYFFDSVEKKIPTLIDEITPYAELNDDGKIELTEELEVVCSEYRYGYQTDVENFSLLAQEDVEKLQNLTREDVERAFHFYFNYKDSHIYCTRDNDFYYRLFNDEIEDFADLIGIGKVAM